MRALDKRSVIETPMMHVSETHRTLAGKDIASGGNDWFEKSKTVPERKQQRVKSIREAASLIKRRELFTHTTRSPTSCEQRAISATIILLWILIFFLINFSLSETSEPQDRAKCRPFSGWVRWSPQALFTFFFNFFNFFFRRRFSSTSSSRLRVKSVKAPPAVICGPHLWRGGKETGGNRSYAYWSTDNGERIWQTWLSANRQPLRAQR